MKRNRKKLRFISHPNIQNSFTGESLTAYSGLNPLGKFIEKLGIRKELDQLFPTFEYTSLKFLNVQVLLSIIFASLSGVNRLNHITYMSADPLVMKLLGLTTVFNKDLISSRLKSFGQAGAMKLHDYFQLSGHRFLTECKLKAITLDVDSTVQGVCGKQEGSGKGYNPTKKGGRSYHNLIGFVSNLKLVINTWFRDGTAYTSNGICEFVKEIHARLPEEIGVFFRADSGFFNGELFDLLDTWKWEYLVKVKLKGLQKLLKQQEWVQADDGNEYCQFKYKCGKWKKERQFYGVRKIERYEEKEFFEEKHNVPVYTYSCFCSTLKESPKSIYKQYRERSTSETWIEEVKSQARAGSTMTNNFYANEMLWLLSTMAYNIGVMARHRSRKQREKEHKTFSNIFVTVPGKLTNLSGKMYLRIYEQYYFYKQWLEIEVSLE